MNDKFGEYDPVGGQRCSGCGREITPELEGIVLKSQPVDPLLVVFQCAHCGTESPVPLKWTYPEQ